MKKNKIICLILAVLLIFTLLLSACSFKDKKWVPSDIASKMTYDEAKVKEEFAKEKNGAMLAKVGQSDVIVEYSKDSSQQLQQSAVYLAQVLNQIVGSTTIIAREEIIDLQNNFVSISLGETQKNNDINIADVKDDGYAVKITENSIHIKGINDNGTQNGIYGFLEDKLEVMFVAHDFDYIPSFPTIYLAEDEYIDNPTFAWRRVFQYETLQNEWYKKLKNNGTVANGHLEGENAGWGTWCHNVFEFVPPSTYFESNPEFYAQIDGVRRYEIDGVTTQLCLTNPDIYAVIEKSMEEKMAQKPLATYWDFSINDNYSYCQCDDCEASFDKYGSRMGVMLEVINKLAVKFPDKIISTLAYFYNSDPPKDLLCEDNVNITIAPIATGQAYSYLYGDTKSAKRAKDMIEQWSAVSNRILVWDYTVNFAHLLLPYPNYDVQPLNLEFYEANNVKSVFHQGSREKNDEMTNFRSYILSKQLWDRNVDWQALAGKYLQVYYGSAGAYVAQYLDSMSNAVYKKANNLDLYDDPSWHTLDYLSIGQIKKYTKLLESAKAEVADNTVILERLEHIEINILYAKMYESSFDIYDKKVAFDRFSELVKKYEITRESEWGNMDEFLNGGYQKYLAEQEKLSVMVTIIPIACIIAIGTIILVIVLKIKKRPKTNN